MGMTVKHVTLEYLKRRAAEEIYKANCAPSRNIAAIHRTMADAYYGQIERAPGGPADKLSPDALEDNARADREP